MSYSVARFVFDSDGKRMWGFVFNSVCILEPEMYERCGPRRPRPYGEKCSCEGEPCSVFCDGDPMGWRGEGVGDAEGEGRQPLTGGASCLESSHGREPCIVSPGNGSDVGNPTNERHERTRAAWGRCAGSADAGRHAWPPGPEDREGWARYIAEGGPEPVVRRGSDGPSSRLDRLHCLGNAVVPQVARVAFETLYQRAFR